MADTQQDRMEKRQGTINVNTKVSLGFLIAIAGIFIALVAGGFGVVSKSNAALPRDEAAMIYVSRKEYDARHAELLAAIGRVSDQVQENNRLIMQHMTK